MDLHILFSQKPDESVDVDASSFPLHLEDEVQYRCSEFVQKEVTRFKDHLQELYPQAKGAETDGSDVEGSDGEHVKKGKKGRSRSANADRSTRECSQIQQTSTCSFLVKCRRRLPTSNASMSSFGLFSPS